MVINLPFEVINDLNIKEDDDVDFFKYGKYYLIAKKSDILALITHKTINNKSAVTEENETKTIDDNELKVLKKLDTIRYKDRTKENLKKMLTEEERKVLNNLIKNKIVIPFKRANENEIKYSIEQNIYNKFLFGKRDKTVQNISSNKNVEIKTQATEPKEWEKNLSEDAYINLLESKGYIIISDKNEAEVISTKLEDSIRKGVVIGTRAFNKKYYIALKSFVAKYSPNIIKLIKEKGASVSEISRAINLEEDGVYTILYLLADSGDVIETKKDYFKLV
ncbi:MAG: hypothetical protein ACP5RI_01910 [Candidatus Micrarchaeia archaeon]